MEQDLIRITESEGKQVVSARELYINLGYDVSHYARWAKSNVTDNPYAIEGEDWCPLATNGDTDNQSVNPTKDYALSVTLAKKIAMMAKSEIGNSIRDYFIECERAAKLSTLSSYQIEDPIKRAERWIEEQKEHKLAIEQKQARIEEMKPKEEFFDQVTDSKDACDMATVAKVLNVGIVRNRLFEILRDEKVLMGNNQPMQRYVDAGYFRIVESKFTKPSGDICINFKIIVYQSGIIFIRRLLEKLKDKK